LGGAGDASAQKILAERFAVSSGGEPTQSRRPKAGSSRFSGARAEEWIPGDEGRDGALPLRVRGDARLTRGSAPTDGGRPTDGPDRARRAGFGSEAQARSGRQSTVEQPLRGGDRWELPWHLFFAAFAPFCGNLGTPFGKAGGACTLGRGSAATPSWRGRRMYRLKSMSHIFIVLLLQCLAGWDIRGHFGTFEGAADRGGGRPAGRAGAAGVGTIGGQCRRD
jgi:hypothetical protein